MLVVHSAGKTWKMADPGGNIAKRLRRGEPYEKGLLDDIASRNLSGSAFDVGAHVGNHSLYLAVACGLTVHAFEGDTRLVSQLEANVAANEADITIHPYAVGDAPGWGSWWLDGRNKKLDVGEGPVEVRRIDDMVEVSDLAVVKLDIEGMEPAALRGMARHLTQRPLIYTETHTPEAMAATATVLEPYGYRMTGRHEYKGRMCRWEA